MRTEEGDKMFYEEPQALVIIEPTKKNMDIVNLSYPEIVLPDEPVY